MFSLDLKSIILKILSHSPKHGYQLTKEIGEIFGQEPSLGGMYPVLKSLEKKGLILGHNIIDFGRFKKVYKITDKGKKKVKEIDRDFKILKQFMEK